MLKLCFNATTLRNFNIKKAVRLIHESGYEGVELALNNTHLHPMSSTKDEIIAVKNTCKEIGLQIACVAAGGPDLMGDAPYEPSMINADLFARMRRLDMIRRSVEMAQLLECPIVNINSGVLSPAVNPQMAQNYLLDGISSLLPSLGNETMFVLEPEPGFFVGTTTKAIEVIDELSTPKLMLNLDIGHVFCCEEDCYDKVERALPYTRHIHIEDIKDRIHHHEIPGEGDIDFGRIMTAINNADYPYFVSVELHHHDRMWQRALDESRDYLLRQCNCRGKFAAPYPFGGDAKSILAAYL
jgi:sugar phosphate isomerase/epimerase